MPSKRETESTEFSGLRHNEDKIPWSYIFEFSGALRGVSLVADFGAKKYSRENWKEGLCEYEILDSLGRHLDAVFYDKQIYDDESGCHHLAHAAWNILALLEQRLTRGTLVRSADGEIRKVNERSAVKITRLHQGPLVK